jgi:2-polyprenyl-3-methyl-5-hydroxy-6-metoxy-1,4-benzoquinol methylase
MMARLGIEDFNRITDMPGQKATAEQLSRIFSRYHFARQYAEGKDVLDVGCGSGLGLTYIAEIARKVVGGDIDEKNVTVAKEICSKNKKVVVTSLNAHNLFFRDESFDLILLFEVIYHLDNPDRFLAEAHRVLRGNGILLISSVNKDWRDFHPSIFARRYYSVPELNDLLKNYFSNVEIYGAFMASYKNRRDRAASYIKRAASRMNIIPGSLKARVLLKRLFIGKLYTIPNKLTQEMAAYEVPIPLDSSQPTDKFKIIYAVAYKI